MLGALEYPNKLVCGFQAFCSQMVDASLVFIVVRNWLFKNTAAPCIHGIDRLMNDDVVGSKPRHDGGDLHSAAKSIVFMPQLKSTHLLLATNTNKTG